MSLRWIAVFAAPLVALSLACSVVSGPEVDVDLPGVETNLGQMVLFQDDFSDTSSGWDRVDAAEGVTDYTNGGYRIFVDQTQHDYWGNPGLDFSDVRVEVDATKVAGPDDNDLGVLCRYQDAQNFYAFYISSDGYASINKVEGGNQEQLGSEKWLETSAVRQGNATNRIRADCVGDSLTLYANGELVHMISDSTFASGDVGLIAGTFSEAGTDILFDNFVVLQP